MKRIFFLVGIILFTIAANAAPVVITATITDSDSTPWSTATWTAQLSAGGPVFGGSTDGSGVLSDSTDFQAGSVYDVTICSNAFVNCSAVLDVTISTSAVFQTTINAGITAPRFPASGALHTSFGYADVELSNPTVNDSYFNVLSGVTRYFCGTLGWGVAACSPLRPVNTNGITITQDGANVLFKPTSPSNLNNWRVLSSIAGASDGDVRIQHSADGFSSINGDFRISPTGVITAYSDVLVGGNVNVQGTISSTQNTQPASITNSGVALTAAPTVADEIYYNSTYTVNNRTAEHIWFGNCLQSRFKSDNQSTAIVPLSLCGGQGTGITGITSNSGSGVWVHTGNFSATGTISTNAFNNITLTAGVSGSNAVVSVGGGNPNAGLTIAPSGSGQVTINNGLSTPSATVNGSLVCTANGANCSYAPIYATTGSIGGALLAVGACSTGTATIAGGVAGHTVTVSPSTGVDPGGGFVYRGVVTNSTTVTVQICAAVLGTPTAVTYNIATY